MASAPIATNPLNVKTCEHCGANFTPSRYAKGKFCSQACINRSRADHSTETLMRRFWAKVDKSAGFGPKGECWRWTARIDGRGYGEIKVAGRYKKAHRLALFGPHGMDDERFACHRCDNPQCVRPDHLFAGEAVDNVRDMMAKGRGAPMSARKLSVDQVREVRSSSESNLALGAKYGVNEGVIRQIRNGNTYKDIPDRAVA